MAVRLTYRVTLSDWNAEKRLHERSIYVTFETVYQWCLKFEPIYARRMLRKSRRPFSIWHIDKLLLRITSRQHYLWRAVDAEGEVLDVLLQSRRNKTATMQFLKMSIRRTASVPTTVVTEKWCPPWPRCVKLSH